MFAVNSALAALTFRAKTGKGQHIDCSLLDSQIVMLANQSQLVKCSFARGEWEIIILVGALYCL